MDNLPPGVSVYDLEPREHYRQCRTNCEHAGWGFDEEKALEIAIGIAYDVSWWKLNEKTPHVNVLKKVKEDLERMLELCECPNAHRGSHECDCEEIAACDEPYLGEWGWA